MHPSSVASVSQGGSLSSCLPPGEKPDILRLQVTSPEQLSQQKSSPCSGLRLVVPGNDEQEDCLSWPGTPDGCTTKQLYSQRRLPAPALLKLVLPTAPLQDDSPDTKLHQLSGCHTARRLDFDQDDTDLSLWLDQQISTRTSARSVIGGAVDGHFSMPTGIQPGGAFAATAVVGAGNLPPPAFQLLGLL